MNNDYADITERLGAPQWWDEAAVPRYCDFGPNQAANIYAKEVVLLHIECQNCGKAFKVAMSNSGFDVRMVELTPRRIAEAIADGSIHYGDPPNYGCCPAGPTMNSVPRRVLEYWERERMNWRRREDLEVELEVDWAGEE